MPTRRLPKTIQEILTALRIAFNKSEAFPDKAKLAFTEAVYLLLVDFLPNFETQISEEGDALREQTLATETKVTSFDRAAMFVSHFFQGFNNAIARGIFVAADRAYYHIDVNDNRIPTTKSEADLQYWALNIKNGEALRVADGGTPMAWPTAVQVDTEYKAYAGHQLAQSGYKDSYVKEHGDVMALIIEAKALVKDIWDDVENTFRHDEPSLLRNKAREWGVVYDEDEAPEPGEEPTVFRGDVPPAASVVVTQNGFDGNSTFLATNTGEVALELYTSNSANGTVPPTTVKIAPAEQKEIFASDLGAAGNTFLMAYNPDENTAGSYEVEVE